MVGTVAFGAGAGRGNLFQSQQLRACRLDNLLDVVLIAFVFHPSFKGLSGR